MNKYSPLTFFGLLMISMVFVVEHAQDNSASGTKDPFEIMLNQAREQQRQKILHDLAKSKKEHEAQNSQIDRERLSKQQKQDGEINENGLNNQPATNITNTPNTSSSTSTSLPPNIPMPSTNSTNNNAPPSPPINIYIPPPPPSGVNPLQGGQAQSSMGKNVAPSSKTVTNIYG